MLPSPLRGDYQRLRFAQGPDRRLHFELAIPGGLVPMHEEEGPGEQLAPFARVARFVGPDPAQLEVCVSLGLLNREVSAGDLTALDLARSGAVVLRRRDREGAAGCDCAFVAETRVGNVPCLRRVRTVKDGNRLFRIDATAPRAAFPAADETTAVPLASFRLLSPEGLAYAEPLKRCQGPSPHAFSFDYPAGWELFEPPALPERAAFWLKTSWNGKLLGRITVEVGPRQPTGSPGRLLRDFADHLEADGTRVCGSAVVPVKPPTGFSAAHFYAPSATSDGRPLAVAALVLEHPDLLLRIGVLSPSSVDSPWALAINKRAFEIARDTFSVGPKGRATNGPPERRGQTPS